MSFDISRMLGIDPAMIDGLGQSVATAASQIESVAHDTARLVDATATAHDRSGEILTVLEEIARLLRQLDKGQDAAQDAFDKMTDRLDDAVLRLGRIEDYTYRAVSR